MNRRNVALLFLALVVAPNAVPSARADFVGPSTATNAISPDGTVVARIVPRERSSDAKQPIRTHVVVYRFDAAKDGFVRSVTLEIADYPPNLLFVSDSGRLAFVNLSDEQALALYGADGKPIKKWNLGAMLSEREIKACAQTGSTTQWLHEGWFDGDDFGFRGPSYTIRALQGSFTVMRGVDIKVEFGARYDSETGELDKFEGDELPKSATPEKK